MGLPEEAARRDQHRAARGRRTRSGVFEHHRRFYAHHFSPSPPPPTTTTATTITASTSAPGSNDGPLAPVRRASGVLPNGLLPAENEACAPNRTRKSPPAPAPAPSSPARNTAALAAANRTPAPLAAQPGPAAAGQQSPAANSAQPLEAHPTAQPPPHADVARPAASSAAHPPAPQQPRLAPRPVSCQPVDSPLPCHSRPAQLPVAHPHGAPPPASDPANNVVVDTGPPPGPLPGQHCIPPDALLPVVSSGQSLDVPPDELRCRISRSASRARQPTTSRRCSRRRTPASVSRPLPSPTRSTRSTQSTIPLVSGPANPHHMDRRHLRTSVRPLRLTGPVLFSQIPVRHNRPMWHHHRLPLLFLTLPEVLSHCLYLPLTCDLRVTSPRVPHRASLLHPPSHRLRRRQARRQLL